MRRLIIGTRGSKLACWQTDRVAAMLKARHPQVEIEVKVIHTQGDKLLDVALSKIGDKGLFTREIDQCMCRREVDLAVHSMKDVPTELEPGLEIGAILEREEPYDVLLTPDGRHLDNLPPGARIGTSSLRRQAQLLALRPDLQLVDLRGNLDTRVRRMGEMGLDGIVLALAGVKRLGMTSLVAQVLKPTVMLPAVGQGALAIEIRAQDEEIKDLVRGLESPGTRAEVEAERAFLGRLGGGCQVPIGALARWQAGQLTMQGVVADLEGRRLVRVEGRGPDHEAGALGHQMAVQALEQGADEILDRILRDRGSVTRQP